MDVNKLKEFADLIQKGAAGFAELAKSKMDEAMEEAKKMGPDHAKAMKEAIEKADLHGQVKNINTLVEKIQSHISGK
jgi:hypothetical protein